MKLELKHLAPYLPYDLQFLSGHYLVGIYTGNDNDITRPLLMSETPKGEICWEANFDMDIPYLRPLSDLTKEIDKDKLKWFPKSKTIEYILHELDILELSYNEIDYLLKNHFDVFGLIENNLAIDINTL